METIVMIESDVLDMIYEPDQQLLIQRWKGAELTNEKYKNAILQILEHGKRMAELGMFIRYEIIFPQFNFIISPELQEWSAQVSYEIIRQSGLKKLAVVIPKEVQEQIHIEALSVEQTIEEMAKIGVEYRVVASEAEARKWFSSSKS